MECREVKEYARCYSEGDVEDGYKIDCILFAADEQCTEKLRRYAKDRFHRLNDSYRRYLVDKDAQTRAEYDTIVTNGDPVGKRNPLLPEFIGCSTHVGKVSGDVQLASEV